MLDTAINFSPVVLSDTIFISFFLRFLVFQKYDGDTRETIRIYWTAPQDLPESFNVTIKSADKDFFAQEIVPGVSINKYNILALRRYHISKISQQL